METVALTVVLAGVVSSHLTIPRKGMETLKSFDQFNNYIESRT